jgi:hypothetical protein
MSSPVDFGEMMTAWAAKTPSVGGLVLIGSRERSATNTLEYADAYSDWDFQIITSNPRMFLDRAWMSDLPGIELIAYAARTARIGGVPKVNVVLKGAESDMVIIPAAVARLMRLAVAFGLHRRNGRLRRRAQDLAEVIRPGWRFLKGGETWDPLFRRITADVSDPRLGDEEARQLAEGFVCDYVWCLRKILRGEFRTTQRMLFQEMAEVNLQLMHELKRRRGERTFTKARRIERTANSAELESITLIAPLDVSALHDALEKSAATCRQLMQALVGESWRWPETD